MDDTEQKEYDEMKFTEKVRSIGDPRYSPIWVHRFIFWLIIGSGGVILSIIVKKVFDFFTT